ncbi:MAG: helix-turn-helix transcriptional regulator [Bacteroides sp.]|nr:helix-turn-helix transcriptional regulator [Bacteroides sp.]
MLRKLREIAVRESCHIQEQDNFPFPIKNKYLKSYIDKIGMQRAIELWYEQVAYYRKPRLDLPDMTARMYRIITIIGLLIDGKEVNISKIVVSVRKYLYFCYKFRAYGKVTLFREIMQRQGVSIAELAARVGVTKSSAASYLVHDLRLSKAKKIANALEVSLPALFVEPEVYTQSAPEETKQSSVCCPKCGAELQISVKHK